MKDILQTIKDQIASFSEKNTETHPQFNEFINNCTIALMAGGEGSRMANITNKYGVNKNALELPGGETMIERTIKMYADIGLKNIVALVFNKADSIIDILGDGSKYGVSITYSHDPEKPVGKGGAVKNALMNGSIPESHYLIVHNPDDQVIGDQSAILKNIINQHLYNQDQGAYASVVVVEGSAYHYTGMQIKNSQVTAIEMYPFIPIPAHIGMTLFSSEVYTYFKNIFDLNKKTDFESVLFPILQEEQKLYACNIPLESWIPVNDEKGLKKLIATLKQNNEL